MNQPGSTKNTSVVIARWRFYCVSIGLIVFAVAVVWHLARLQVIPGEDKGFEFLQTQGAARTVRTETINAYRGVITDRHGEPLAVSTPVDSIWANPHVLLESGQINSPQWKKLATILNSNESRLIKKVNRYRHKEFVYLKRHLSPSDAEKVLSLDISGIYTQREYQRFYPAAEVASHIVGFTDIDDHGQEGIELAYDSWLSGSLGEKKVVKDLKGRVIREAEFVRAARPGQDLTLSIDLRLQYLVYRELKTAVTEHRAKAGSVVVIDTRSGEVLAIANQPAYNPNDRKGIKAAALRNRAIVDQFEPGSTMKPVTVMAALESGRYSPHTLIDTNPGYIRVGKKLLPDPINYGVIDVTTIISKSSQVGISKIALNLEPQQIRDMFYRLGLGQTTGSGFPGESVGVLPNHQRWQPIERANLAFGYGLSLTAIQLAQAYSVIANEGEKKPVSLLKLSETPETERVVSKKIASQTLTMLKTVVGPDGTAKSANLKSYSVAGKTGTARKIGDNGYDDNRHLALFAGIAPADQPQIAVVITIDEPNNGKHSGGQVAAPLFARIAAGVLRVLEVSPEMISSVHTVKNNSPAGRPMS